MSDDFISCDFPDLDEYIRQLDLMDDNVNKALREGLNSGADIIRDAQRRLILGKPTSAKSKRKHKGGLAKLAKAIDKGEIFATKKGAIGIKIGYQPEAFKNDAEGFNAGVTGMTIEFGRPGQSSSTRRSSTMVQMRNEKRVSIHKGSIQPYPHIRPGHDSHVEQASQEVINKYNQVIDKLGE